MVNKFLHPKGGAETYTFKVGEYLQLQGHEVQYFGMNHEGRCVGNAVDAYTSDMDFHGHLTLEKMTYSLKTIYSREARRKIRLVLDDFQPDVVHLNNFNYQLTPSVILEIQKWKRQNGHKCKIVFTAHDYNLICPNHMLNNPVTHQNCEKCLGGHFINCAKGKCIHRSRVKSLVGMMEGYFWRWMRTYRYIDCIICCSTFLKSKMDRNPMFAEKTIVMHNFVNRIEGTGFPFESEDVEKKDYVLYFGRYSEEKGINTLVEACRELPEINFVFAGAGPLEGKLTGIKNIENVGFQRGEKLEKLIREARFSVCPSEAYENCPFSVLESQLYGTPVLGAAIGGIPELIQDGVTGELFESGNRIELRTKLLDLWSNKKKTEKYAENYKVFDNDYRSLGQYCLKLIEIYQA